MLAGLERAVGHEAGPVALGVGLEPAGVGCRSCVPATDTAVDLLTAGRPRKLIWVRGFAVPVSGAGDTEIEVAGS